MHRSFVFVLFLWLAVLVSANVYAQISESPGSVACPPLVNLTVTVTTEHGTAVIPNALVILREDTLGQPNGVKALQLELRTDQKGEVTAAVSCNYLDVLVAHNGFAPAAQKFLITNDEHTFSVPLKMYPVKRTTEVLIPQPVQPLETPSSPGRMSESAQYPTPLKPVKVRVSQQVLDTLAVKKVSPSTQCSKDKGHENGDVTIAVLVDYDGRVKSATLLSGDRALADCAITAIQQWQFKPYRIDDIPVQVESRIVVKFSR